MSNSDIFISKGKCYSAKGEELDDSFIPCGNDDFGHVACCGRGDTCLTNNSCFGIHGSGYGSYLTYMAGCTDSDYKDSSCPNKDIDQPWVALTRCDDHEDEWAICSQEGDPSTLKPGSFCSCTEAASATVAFTAKSVLDSSCSLPQSTGESIQYFAGYFPTQGGSGSGSDPGSGSGSDSGSDNSNNGGGGGSPNETGGGTNPTGGSSSGSDNTSPSPTGSTPDPGDNSGPGSGLSTGAKIGIGIGLVVGILAILAALVAICVVKRRRKRARSDPDAVAAAAAAAKQQRESTNSAYTASEIDGQAVSELDGHPAPPWSMRKELEGNNARPSADLSPVAELPGNTSWLENGRR